MHGILASFRYPCYCLDVKVMMATQSGVTDLIKSKSSKWLYNEHILDEAKTVAIFLVVWSLGRNSIGYTEANLTPCS